MEDAEEEEQVADDGYHNENRQIQLNLNTCRSNLASVSHICFALSRALFISAIFDGRWSPFSIGLLGIGHVTMMFISRRKCRKCTGIAID